MPRAREMRVCKERKRERNSVEIESGCAKRKMRVCEERKGVWEERNKFCEDRKRMCEEKKESV